MIGGSLIYDFARVGATPAPFQSFVLSAGVVTDYVYDAGMHWQGGCGGFPCDGSGSLNEWNVIGELKAATPLGGGNTLKLGMAQSHLDHANIDSLLQKMRGEAVPERVRRHALLDP